MSKREPRVRRGRWQFSLRSLMFLTLVVCVGAATIRLSPLVAVAVVPLLLAALIRTIRLAASMIRDLQPDARFRLSATFCRSLGIVLSLVVVSGGALAAACLAAMLIVMGSIAPTVRPAVALVKSTAIFAWRGVKVIVMRLQPAAAGVHPAAILHWSREQSLRGTARLAIAGRRLFQSWWSPASPV